MTRGRVASATATQLTLRPTVPSSPLRGRQPTAAASVSPVFESDRVSKVTRGGDSRWNGALIGLAIGVALPAASAANATADPYPALAAIPFMGGAGLGVGMLIDGMINRRVEVFSAAPTGSRARVEVRPMLRGGTKGATLSLQF